MDILKTEAPFSPVIGAEEVRAATEILKKYRQGKANLEKRVIENEQWFKMRHWQQFRNKSREGGTGRASTRPSGGTQPTRNLPARGS